MGVGDTRLRSYLDETGNLRLSNDAHAALLGNADQRKNRGREETLTTGGNFVRVLDVVGDDQLATEVAITCGLSPATDKLTPQVLGRIQWGTDGASHEAFFDFVQGTILSVAASSVRIDARIESDPEDIGSVIARASLGYYPQGGHRGRRTLRETNVATTATHTFPIPPFASHVSVELSAPAAGPEVDLIFNDTAAAIAGLASLTSSEAARQIPIPNGAVTVTVKNLLGTTQIVNAIFDLYI